MQILFWILMALTSLIASTLDGWPKFIAFVIAVAFAVAAINRMSRVREAKDPWSLTYYDFPDPKIDPPQPPNPRKDNHNAFPDDKNGT